MRSRSSQSRGMALVVVLALVVLVTVVVVAFFAMATSNRQIESSRVHRTQAELLARTAGEYVVGIFAREIQDTAHSDATIPNVFLPRTPQDVLPVRRLASGINSGDTNFLNLVFQTVGNADTNASSHSSTSPARQGRVFGLSRWNLPRLLGGAGFNDNSQAPNWIYVTRNGGITNAPSADVIGRFACNAYDVGGLLNASTAGFPSAASNSSSVSALKGFQAGADLTALGVPQTAVDTLTVFRQPDSATSAASYLAQAGEFAREGYLSLVTTNSLPPQTNNAFTSRQDLLRYAATYDPSLSVALPFLTHFSRSQTAPSWRPDTATASNPVLPGVTFGAAGTVVHYRDDGTPEPLPVEAGDPMMARRFSLAKLAWLTPTGPASNISEDAIRACFGLSWNATRGRWDYVGSDGGSSPLLEIATLSQGAGFGREPNFFEVLKAGIAEGSVGTASAAKTLAGASSQLLEANKDFHLLRIGACIIDQADADNYPTIVSFGGDLEAVGVEDLPYFHQMAMIVLRQTDTSQTPNKLTHADVIWTPVFFNPHRASTPSAGPAEVVMDVARGTLTGVKASSGTELVQALNKDLSGLAPIAIPSTNFETFRARPRPAESGAVGNRLGSQVSYATGDLNAQVLRLFSYQTEYTNPWPANRPASDSAIFRINVDDVIVRLRYRDLSGNLRTYATLAGHEAIAGSGWNGAPHATQGMITGIGPSFLTAGRLQQSDLSLSYYGSLWDPRTNRLGPSYGQTRAMNDLPTTSNTADRIRSETPFAYTNDPAQPVFPALWPEGQRGSQGPGYFSNFADPDGTLRPADASLGSGANLFRDLDDALRRPVVLQRRFQNVAELGYAFRDTPWKTVNFFDGTSGDRALLDLFSVVDEPSITAGRVQLGTRQKPVLEALLKGTGQLPDGSLPLTDSAGIAGGFLTRNFASGEPTANFATNPADLAEFLSSTDMPAGLPVHKAQREAVVRALAPAVQTRTWNFLIDVVAQDGRFTGSSTNAENFSLEGEKRYWLSIAIDRLTAEVLDEQWEAVHE